MQSRIIASVNIHLHLSAAIICVFTSPLLRWLGPQIYHLKMHSPVNFTLIKIIYLNFKTPDNEHPQLHTSEQVTDLRVTKLNLNLNTVNCECIVL